MPDITVETTTLIENFSCAFGLFDVLRILAQKSIVTIAITLNIFPGNKFWYVEIQ